MNTERIIMVSVIIPVYNGFKGIDPNVIKAKVTKEIILIDDGSEDNSAQICTSLANKYEDIIFIRKSHTGVSDTRNAGIKAAVGKYIMFLDSDDTITKGSIEALVNFFEQCYESVDLVTYPIETLYNGHFLPPHFRYQTMNHSGIYDLNIFPYIGQTTMNVMVRNLGKDNVLFDTDMDFSEDQMYCCDVLQRKMKMGFCKEATYIYHRSDESSSGKLSGSCYVFEQAMHMFEKLFARYENKVPLAIQGLYINDLAWKMREGILYPYHYEEKRFNESVERIRALLMRVDSEVIWEHPDIDIYHKFYWLSQKKNSGVSTFFGDNSYGLKIDNKTIVEESETLLVISRICCDENGILLFRGSLRSGVFSFSLKPELYAVTPVSRIKIELFSSAHSYYLCHTKTNAFYAFCFQMSKHEISSLYFEMSVEDKKYPCRCEFLPKARFSKLHQRYSIVINGISLGYDKDSRAFYKETKVPEDILSENSDAPCITFSVAKLRRKAAKLKEKHTIFLYLDCRGVEKDNGYFQFIRDFNKNDGIERYYIGDPDNHAYNKLFNHKQRAAVIMFGSYKHKLYTLAASRLITAYIEDNNILPFKTDEITMVSDLFDFTVQYLQHGILHASLPWKYAPEVIMADKVCISTSYEQKLLTQKYHFREQDLICKLMPRLEELDLTVKPEKKILFAPSWRSYLVGNNINGKWQERRELFLNSDYYNNIVAFLNDNILHEWLVSHNYTMYFKLHPIFKEYRDLFINLNENIKVISSTGAIEQYEYFITDFSSFLYDFLYLGRPTFCFIPDEMQFRCGMNSYREIEPESEVRMVKIKNSQEFCKIISNSKQAKQKSQVQFYD